MKPCEKILLYAQHELPAEEEKEMGAHVRKCPACQQQLALLKRLEEALVPPAAPAELLDKVFAKTTRKKPLLGYWKPVFAGAAAACAAVFLVSEGLVRHPQFDAREVVAYMQANPDPDYLDLASDLTELENYF